MRDLEFLDLDIIEVHFAKDLEEEDEMNLEVSVNYTLNFDEEDRMAFGDCLLTIEDDGHEEKLIIALHTVGIFSYMASDLTDELRRKYHKESIRVLNPKWNTLLKKFTRLVEVPEIELEAMDVDDDDIVLGNNGENLN